MYDSTTDHLFAVVYTCFWYLFLCLLFQWRHFGCLLCQWLHFGCLFLLVIDPCVCVCVCSWRWYLRSVWQAHETFKIAETDKNSTSVVLWAKKKKKKLKLEREVLNYMHRLCSLTRSFRGKKGRRPNISNTLRKFLIYRFIYNLKTLMVTLSRLQGPIIINLDWL